MPRTVEIQLYTLAELKTRAEEAGYFPGMHASPESNAYDRALDTLREHSTGDSFWHESVIEDWTERLKAEGFEDAEIQFRGFSSQGDGASFTARLDVARYMEHHKLRRTFRTLAGAVRREEVEVYGEVRRTSSHYVHENTCRVSLESRFYDVPEHRTAEWERKVEAEIVALEEHMETRRSDLCHEIYQGLEAEYDYQTLEEVLQGNAEANEYEFRENGEIA